MIDSCTLFQMRLEYCQELLDKDKHISALLEIEEVLDVQNECVDALYLAGQTYLLLRDSTSAEHCFRQISSIAYLDEQQSELHLSLALSLFFQYRFKEALDELKNTLRYNSQIALAWRYQAMTQDRLGYFKVATNSANRALRLDPENNILPDWDIKKNISVLHENLLTLTQSSQISDIRWEPYPEKPDVIDRKTISPQQVVYVDTKNCELIIFYGNLKFIASDLDNQLNFLKKELGRVIPTL